MLGNRKLLIGILLLVIFLISALVLGFLYGKGRKTSVSSGNIIVKSEYPGYELTLKDEAKLQKELSTLGFWGEGGVASPEKRTDRVTAKSLTVTLVPEPRGNYFSVQKDRNGNYILGLTARVDEEKNVIIDVFILPEFADSFEFGFWKSIYMVTQYQGVPGTAGGGIDSGKADKFASGFTDTAGNLFEIMKTK